jgi:hypothetical protein
MISIEISHSGKDKILSISDNADYGVLCAENGRGLAYLAYQGVLYQIADGDEVERLKGMLGKPDYQISEDPRTSEQIAKFVKNHKPADYSEHEVTVPLGDEAHPDEEA